MARIYGLPKNERLKSRKEIEEIFSTGRSFSIYPLRVSFQLKKEDLTSLKIGVSASKKLFKKAVDRNYAKRLLRETYRLQKTGLFELIQQKELSCHVFFLYTGNEKPVYKDLYETMSRALEMLKKKIINEPTG